MPVPWAAPAAERFAGVSAFGFGGTNFHAVLAAYADAPPPRQALDAWPAELFLFRGRDEAAAHREVAEILRAAESPGSPWRLRDLALAAARRADTSEQPAQAAVVARDTAELVARLRRVLSGSRIRMPGCISRVRIRVRTRAWARVCAVLIRPRMRSRGLSCVLRVRTRTRVPGCVSRARVREWSLRIRSRARSRALGCVSRVRMRARVPGWSL
ncbi:hypothetical protein LT493_27160 [Streptomyces tricolor]|nr:hypothetical protein [Streptomyces tricolor]